MPTEELSPFLRGSKRVFPGEKYIKFLLTFFKVMIYIRLMVVTISLIDIERTINL